MLSPLSLHASHASSALLASGPLDVIGGIPGLIAALPTLTAEQGIGALDIITPVLAQAGTDDETLNRLAGSRSKLRMRVNAEESPQLEKSTIDRLQDCTEQLVALDTPDYESAASNLLALIQGTRQADIGASWATDPELWRVLPKSLRDDLRQHASFFAMPSLLSHSQLYHARFINERFNNWVAGVAAVSILFDETFKPEPGEREEIIEETRAAVIKSTQILDMLVLASREKPDFVSTYLDYVISSGTSPGTRLNASRTPEELIQKTRDSFSNITKWLRLWNRTIGEGNPLYVSDSVLAQYEALFAPAIARLEAMAAELAFNPADHVVLIADDEDDLLETARRILSRQKYGTVLTAHNGKEALDILKEHPEITALVTDTQMPVMDALELIRQLRVFRPTLSVLQLSAYPDFSDSFPDDPHWAFLQKPFDSNILPPALRNIILASAAIMVGE